MNLPGLGVLLGGMWVANLYYWGFNQYIIQRALAAKSLQEAQKGIVLAAFLKILLPFIIVIPGIAAYVILQDSTLLGSLGEAGLQNLPSTSQADKAYPWLIQFLPTGLKGLAFVALAAAIFSSLASMLNSTATIFTMDIYKGYFKTDAKDAQLVQVGRLVGIIALIIGALLAPLLGGIPQAFQFIQEYTGIVSPGILAVFLLGLFWKKSTNQGAIKAVLLSIPIAMFFKVGPKGWMADSAIANWFPNLPFLDQMAYTLLLSMAVLAFFSWIENKGKDDVKGFTHEKDTFVTNRFFNLNSYIVLLILAFLYAFFW
jgi:SSS family solute:Na+ symporter